MVSYVVGWKTFIILVLGGIIYKTLYGFLSVVGIHIGFGHQPTYKGCIYMYWSIAITFTVIL